MHWLTFTAGAMLFVIVDEIIPDIDQKALGQIGTLGVMVGFVVMMFLDVTHWLMACVLTKGIARGLPGL